MPHGILGGHAATHPQQIAGVSSLLELVSSIINITLQVVGFKNALCADGRKAGTRTRIMRLSVARTNQLYYLSIKEFNLYPL